MHVIAFTQVQKIAYTMFKIKVNNFLSASTKKCFQSQFFLLFAPFTIPPPTISKLYTVTHFTDDRMFYISLNISVCLHLHLTVVASSGIAISERNV